METITIGYFLRKQLIAKMRNFQDAFETGKQQFISAFSICMTVPRRVVCQGL